jgi:hypothetical protein
MTVRDPWEDVPFTLSDDFSGAPDFLGNDGVGEEVELELGGTSAVDKLARVKITPQCTRSVRGGTGLETQRELGVDVCRLGTQGRVEVGELREQ